ncbi:unnamed protein product [Zymoseptoria tritici ST99CH_1E4]|uniref:Uncharacterized protein n=1 Tax=Zymoseptoria tritici ST99CH_1E4 TaxID=1276532 RepID=A0A2H1GQH1_ZYMTR|nr:unnamed protein product [Zymoseptoria tritici ST99CH_1E4]
MFEYGAPLLAAFAEDSPKFWDETTKDVAKLTKWISGYASNPHFTRNLLGISALPSRFKALKTGFQVVKKHAPEESPLRKLGLLIWKPKAFFRRLTEDKLYEKYRKTPESWPRDRSLSEDRRSVQQFLRQEREEDMAEEAKKWSLTRIIPGESRLKRDLRGADHFLKAPRSFQKRFL